jgi:hypothetical protein
MACAIVDPREQPILLVVVLAVIESLEFAYRLGTAVCLSDIHA